MATVLRTAQVNVTAVPILLLGSLGTRTEARIRPLSAGTLFIGKDNTVTPLTGYNPCGNNPQAQEEAKITGLTGDIWGVCVAATGGMLVAVMDIG